MFHIIFMALLLPLSTALNAAISQPTDHNVYHQIIPCLTQNLNIEQLTYDQKNLVQCAIVFMKHGINHTYINPENLRAIASVDYFTDILPQHFKTQTNSGYIQLALQTAELCDNPYQLRQRQDLIKYYINNEDLLKQTTACLQAAQPGEQYIVDLVTAQDNKPIRNLSWLEKLNWYQFIAQKANSIKKQRWYQYIAKTSEAITHNKYSREIANRSIQLSTITLPLQIKNSVQKLFKTPSFEELSTLDKTKKLAKTSGFILAMILIQQKTDITINMTSNDPAENQLYLIYALAAAQTFLTSKSYNLFATAYAKQKALLSVARLLDAMKNLSMHLKNHPELHQPLGHEIDKISQLFDPKSTTVSDDLKFVIKELQSSSFKGEASYCVSLQGKIVSTHYWLEKCVQELVSYLEAFGKIDAYITIAQTFKKYQNHPTLQFCFPTFIDSAKPMLIAKDYWHPLLDPKTIVFNSMEIGTTPQTKNILITGPNAGGKTTSLMSLMINIIMAQSMGIAPSSELTFTPFTKIHSYLDITTNLQEGLSLFAAEVERAKKLKESILSCQPGQKTFTIIDEIFSGTNPDVASKVGFNFAQKLGEMDHSMTIITTHFPRLTALEAECGTFTNYKVADATIMPNGQIVYPFKLVPGISQQNIAEHMLMIEDVI